MTIRYDDRVAVVTGAGAGLGRCHALLLASRGAKVVVNDLGGAVDGTGGAHAAADKVVDEIRAAGGEATANYDSVDTPASAAAIVQTATDTYGKLDILVNNAGILRDKSFGKVSMDDFEAVIRVHLMGGVYCTHAAWPVLAENGYGRVVMTTSASGLYGNFGQTNYAAAKLALVGFMNALKLEGQKNNVLVNTIAPVATTRMTESLMPEEANRLLQPEFVAAMVAYFCSEACEHTGETVEAGAGHYAAVRIVEAKGVSFGTDAEVTPDMIHERYAEIRDLTGATPFVNSSDAVAKVLTAAAGG